MPKLGMQPIRSHALIEAVIAEIGETGTMEVTVSQIARRAGMFERARPSLFRKQKQDVHRRDASHPNDLRRRSPRKSRRAHRPQNTAGSYYSDLFQ